MSEVASPAWSCFRKKAYRDEAIAKKVARRINEERDANVRAYGCVECGQFHVGKVPRS